MLDEACFGLSENQELLHPLHPDHPLLLISSPPWIRAHICDGCSSLCPTFIFQCKRCDFTLDVQCALSKENQGRRKLEVADGDDELKKIDHDSAFFPQSQAFQLPCGLALHMICANQTLLSSPLKHECHQHNLYYIVGSDDGEGNDEQDETGDGEEDDSGESDDGEDEDGGNIPPISGVPVSDDNPVAESYRALVEFDEAKRKPKCKLLIEVRGRNLGRRSGSGSRKAAGEKAADGCWWYAATREEENACLLVAASRPAVRQGEDALSAALVTSRCRCGGRGFVGGTMGRRRKKVGTAEVVSGRWAAVSPRLGGGVARMKLVEEEEVAAAGVLLWWSHGGGPRVVMS
ncbi:hypothetical protein Tsubulata_047793 [Turnera subulata]|uniref:DC1 domain-containing protein n=1 Tax=Turnera subulata TaxID=218843 RepID=A0A9Q0FN75_9ROSI|nr:hypothetical protein Tsubulata_047793 [Turnera subulata]